MEARRKIRIGFVISRKMEKTAIVGVEVIKRHPLYHKTFRRVIKYKVHDEENQCQAGDKVKIIETRPLSREKRWRLLEVVSRKEVAELKEEELVPEVKEAE
ncbi:MAG: 30S ribosomal protein S17 [Dehalococcoidales bacterium]|jgi:small subunit ribosomal protein S17|nr:30S ribosomal protein S17 [Dehalococcoidales bacterium]MDD3264471.1 30S ribosomal protein S17 [Dehalococcoidales bacterium]MDD4322002.1 30S ribosomal protein S17 [Dehalococcoidales bacterium]MDD4793905.1 30S ribosomal protein S17 [Dehalococcoidales bacterium]MDD5122089.1 30S ribosomal protein S17 [Dehalococcoidales bacterium]